MTTLLPEQLTENLHETNSRLGVLLDSLLPPSAPAGTEPRAATPHQMAALLAELMRVGQWLRAMPEWKDIRLERELAEYRGQVERLRTMLPSIQSALLKERARLEQGRNRLQSATEWAQASRQTF